MQDEDRRTAQERAGAPEHSPPAPEGRRGTAVGGSPGAQLPADLEAGGPRRWADARKMGVSWAPPLWLCPLPPRSRGSLPGTCLLQTCSASAPAALSPVMCEEQKGDWTF